MTRLEATEVCERCGIPRDMGESAGYEACRTEDDYATDGYPEPGEAHVWVRVDVDADVPVTGGVR